MPRVKLIPRQFGSDNFSGICPEAWSALAGANLQHTRGYGDDPWTERAVRLIRRIFETRCEVFFVFNGTAANSLGLAAAAQSYHSILCHESSHLERDECGAPEFFSHGAKLITLKGDGAKISPHALEEALRCRHDVHFPNPAAISLTQATEFGTVYSVAEIRQLARIARKHGLRVHMDGARFANAAASLRVRPKELTWKAGVDILSLGGTKNGLSSGEVVVFFDRDLAKEFQYRRKQAGQLCSKMRLISAQWIGLLNGGVWLKNAAHANRMAGLLETKLRGLGLQILFPRQANSVFIQLPQTAIDGMHKRGWVFYDFLGNGGCRLMCSWDTSQSEINRFVRELKQSLALPGRNPKN